MDSEISKFTLAQFFQAMKYDSYCSQNTQLSCRVSLGHFITWVSFLGQEKSVGDFGNWCCPSWSKMSLQRAYSFSFRIQMIKITHVCSSGLLPIIHSLLSLTKVSKTYLKNGFYLVWACKHFKAASLETCRM